MGTWLAFHISRAFATLGLLAQPPALSMPKCISATNSFFTASDSLGAVTHKLIRKSKPDLADTLQGYGNINSTRSTRLGHAASDQSRPDTSWKAYAYMETKMKARVQLTHHRGMAQRIYSLFTIPTPASAASSMDADVRRRAGAFRAQYSSISDPGLWAQLYKRKIGKLRITLGYACALDCSLRVSLC